MEGSGRVVRVVLRDGREPWKRLCECTEGYRGELCRVACLKQCRVSPVMVRASAVRHSSKASTVAHKAVKTANPAT